MATEAQTKDTRRRTGTQPDRKNWHQPPRPDPRTGEVPAGPGDAGLSKRPEINAGSPGTQQMSNSRLGIGLGIAALAGLVVFLVAALF
jgi:hypothetical protein